MNKPPLVILHGWGLSGARFSDLTRELKNEGYRVFAPDFPGFGTSLVPSRAWTLSDYAQFLHEFTGEKKLTKPVLIGHSFGGRVALKFNAIFPGSVSALILTGVPGFTPIPKQRLMLFISLAKLGKLVFSVPPLSLVQNKVRRWYYYVIGAKEFYRAEGPMRETFKKIVAEELVGPMKMVTVPCLLVWGEGDIIVPPSIASRMQKAIGGSQLVLIPNVDHGVPFKEPKIFVSNIKRFLESL